MNKAVIALLGASAFVLSTAGIAGRTTTISSANTDANNTTGVYLSGNMGYGKSDNKLDNHLPAGESERNTGFAWSSALGYQFNPYLAVEAGYIRFANYEDRVDADNNTKLTTYAIDVAVKGIYPINEQFNVFGKAGLAYMSHGSIRTKDTVVATTGLTNHHIVPLFGLGASYNLTQNLALDLQGIVTVKSGKQIYVADGKTYTSELYPTTYTGLVGLTYKFS